MGAFFDSFSAAPDGKRPPKAVTLSASLRTHAGTESIVLEYRLDKDNKIFFEDAPENPGRQKRIILHRTVTSGGTAVDVTAPLSYSADNLPRSAFIRAALLPSPDGAPMHEADDEILIR